MAYNETDMLPIWLRHYGAQVGPEACYVVDHGTNDGSTNDLRGANRVRLPRSVLDEPKRAAFIGEFCGALLRYYDYVMYTDSDELVVADPAAYATLLDYVAVERAPVTTAFGMNLLHRLHHEVTVDPTKPILQQRHWGFAVASMCKPVLIQRPVKWSPGFHSADAPIVFDGLFLFHLAYYDLQTAWRRQEKRRRTEKKDATTATHHRVGDDEVRSWVEGWSRMKTDTAVTLDGNCEATSTFAQKVTDSAVGRENAVFGVDLRLEAYTLMQIPPRFRDAF